MISAKEFYEQFKKKLFANDAKFDDESYDRVYLRTKTYTELMNKKVIHEILKENGIKAQNEYYRIDVIGWTDIDNEALKEEHSKAGMKWHSWKLEFAFEHENFYRDWNDEVFKLLYINCPLRVVVGYNNATQRDDAVFGDIHKLDLLAKVIANCNIEIQGEFLIILGNRGKGYDMTKGVENYYGYRAYLYNPATKAFQKI